MVYLATAHLAVYYASQDQGSGVKGFEVERLRGGGVRRATIQTFRGGRPLRVGGVLHVSLHSHPSNTKSSTKHLRCDKAYRRTELFSLTPDDSVERATVCFPSGLGFECQCGRLPPRMTIDSWIRWIVDNQEVAAHTAKPCARSMVNTIYAHTVLIGPCRTMNIDTTNKMLHIY